MPPSLFFWVVLIAVLAACALWLARRAAAARQAVANQAAAVAGRAVAVFGGGAPLKQENIVVDTLNLTHYLHNSVSVKTVEQTIATVAPVLQKHYAGRVVFVLKDRDGVLSTQAADDVRYKRLADRYRIHIAAAYQYKHHLVAAKAADHGSKGRDDLYLAFLAGRYRCAVLTGDRMRDLRSLRHSVPPFYVVEYAYWRTLPAREYIRPEGLPELKRPRRIDPSRFDYG